jgi:hypothetical protein
VWGGDAPRDRAAWYLWLQDTPGAWQVELASAGPLGGAAAGAVVGRLAIRHYPRRADLLFAAFDADERAMAAELLDATGTPCMRAASKIPERAFTVGTIEWALDPERDASLFVLATLDRIRTREAGRVIRDVPGWRLAMPIFSALAGLHAQLDRRAASRLVVARQPGFELVREGSGLEPRDADDVAHGEALLLFGARDGSGEPAARLLAAVRDEAAEVIADASLSPAADPPRVSDARLRVAVSPAWFGGEAHAEGSACAC